MKNRLLLSVLCTSTLLTLSFLLLCQSLLLSELLGSESLCTVVLADGLEDRLLLLGLNDGDGVGEGLLGTRLSFGVRTAHDLDLDTEDTLAEKNVTGSTVNEVLGGLTRVDHETVLVNAMLDHYAIKPTTQPIFFKPTHNSSVP
jgi:hypothetical protein